MEADINKNYDLNLGKWGPYNKEYLGVCHIADEKLGATFNVELFPGFFRRTVMVSPAVNDNGAKMWGANPELTRFCYRYELEWKDGVYCDADFTITDDRRCDINCTFVNNTDMHQSVNMNLCLSMKLPLSSKALYTFVSGTKCKIIDAVEYDSIHCAQAIATQGRYLGEEIMDGATGLGSVISGDSFFDKSHFLRYCIPPTFADSLGIRYRACEAAELDIIVNQEISKRITLHNTASFDYVCISLPAVEVDTIELRPVSNGVDIDCICVGEDAYEMKFEKSHYELEPVKTVEGNRITLQYKEFGQTYAVTCHAPIQMARRFYGSDVGILLQRSVHNHVSEVLYGQGEGVYENILTEPLYLAPGENKTIRFVITSAESVETAAAADYYTVSSNPDGKGYAFSQNMMAYTTFLNVVYPIYCRRGFIRHNTPGRFWDCLYTWDSGFIGMGLGTADFDRAYDCLNTYLTPVGDMHSPFVLRGSVVPTQIFLYQYLFNKYPDKRECLKELYPMIKQYYDFFSSLDKAPGQMKSGLLKTWHLFYNSGGWDDYPPQKYLQNATERGIDGPNYQNTTPVITSSLVIIIAKILKLISEELEIGDTACYDEAVSKYSEAIQNNTWDETCGYFSYLVHNDNGEPERFLTAVDGSNYNQGFDGIYPYISGITTKEQDNRILNNLKNGLMTDIGISVVDKRASYYSNCGYWNGSVWMPHQWILWKALLDRGQIDIAKEIADKALELWKSEVEASYCCFEHFMLQNGRGAGFHQFSGLSTPVLMFFESYYTPGNVTVGFGSVITHIRWNTDFTMCEFECISGNTNSGVIVCMKSGENYNFYVDAKKVDAQRLNDGAYAFILPSIKSRVEIISEQ